MMKFEKYSCPSFKNNIKSFSTHPIHQHIHWLVNLQQQAETRIQVQNLRVALLLLL